MLLTVSTGCRQQFRQFVGLQFGPFGIFGWRPAGRPSADSYSPPLVPDGLCVDGRPAHDALGCPAPLAPLGCDPRIRLPAGHHRLYNRPPLCRRSSQRGLLILLMTLAGRPTISNWISFKIQMQFTCRAENSCSPVAANTTPPVAGNVDHRSCPLPHYIVLSGVLGFLGVAIFLRLPAVVKGVVLILVTTVYLLNFHLTTHRAQLMPTGPSSTYGLIRRSHRNSDSVARHGIAPAPPLPTRRFSTDGKPSQGGETGDGRAPAQQPESFSLPSPTSMSSTSNWTATTRASNDCDSSTR